MRLSTLLAVSMIAVGGVALGACGGEGPPVQSAATKGSEVGARSGGPRGPRSVELLFEAKRPGSKPFPFPFVDVRIGEFAARFMIDTRASVHVIDSGVLKKANMVAPMRASSIEIAGWGTLPDDSVAEVELPSSIRAHGISGILSPQRLAEPGNAGQAIVIDFVRMQLRLAPRSTAWSQVEAIGQLLTPASQALCPVVAAGVQGTVVALEGTVDGEPMKFAIDTGASRSLILESSKGGAKAVTHPVLGRSIALSSLADVPVAIHGGVPVALGGWSSPVDVGVMQPTERLSQCGYEARVGMDVLQYCAVAMTNETVVVGCRTPGP